MRERRWLARADLYSLGLARWFLSFLFFHSFFSRNKSSENKSAVLKI